MWNKGTLAILLMGVLAGCSDPKAPNEANFKQAIQAHLDASYPKCYVNTELPVTIKWDASGVIPQLRALASIGLVVESVGQVETMSFSKEKTYTSAPKFDLTEAGKKFYNPDAGTTRHGGKLHGFCLGKATVQEINQFTEPADMNGHRISRVNYSYTVSDLPDWSNTPEVLAAIPELKAAVESSQKPIQKTDVLVLTSNGWLHEQQYKTQ